MVYIVKLFGRADRKCTVYGVSFHLLTAEYKGNMKIIRGEIMHRAEKSYSIDIVVTVYHVTLIYQT